MAPAFVAGNPCQACNLRIAQKPEEMPAFFFAGCRHFRLISAEPRTNFAWQDSRPAMACPFGCNAIAEVNAILLAGPVAFVFLSTGYHASISQSLYLLHHVEFPYIMGYDYNCMLPFFLLCSIQIVAIAIGSQSFALQVDKRELLQDIVTWDAHSIFVRGQRVLFYSGEFHPFRLPVPALWLDIFQKIKALGYSGVSFYAYWALLEGKQGNFTADGIYAFEPFFAAAQTAGIYLLARPGPYINAEVSGGGYPGWLQRTKEVLRTPDYVKYTENYVNNIGKIISAAQITNGGPIILFQPENEYSQAVDGVRFPDPEYFALVEKQFRDAGIVVP